MNTYTRMKEHAPEPKQYRNTVKNRSWVWALTLKIIMAAILISGAHFARIVFKAKTESLNREAVKIDRQIEIIKQETMHLRNKKAAYSARSYIMSKTGKLGLRAAEYTQIQHVALLREPSAAQGLHQRSYAENTPLKKDRKVTENRRKNSYSSYGKQTVNN